MYGSVLIVNYLFIVGTYCFTIIYRIAGKFGKLTLIKHLAKESVANNRSANRLLIVITNLYGFSLANHERFAKPSCYIVYKIIRKSV